jgi:hypothetical protein
LVIPVLACTAKAGVTGIHRAAGSGACRCLDAGDKPRHDNVPYSGAKLHSQVHVTPTIIPSAAAPSRALRRHADRQFGEAMALLQSAKNADVRVPYSTGPAYPVDLE